MAVPIYSAIRNAQHHAGKHVHMMLSVRQSTIALPPSPNLPLLRQVATTARVSTMDSPATPTAHFVGNSWTVRRKVAMYVVELFHFYRFRSNTDAEELDTPSTRPIPPPISFSLMDDCDSVARMLAQAFQNQGNSICSGSTDQPNQHAVSVLWDAVEYSNSLPRSTTLKKEVEDALLRVNPPITPAEQVIARTTCLPVVRDPAVFTDRAGRILAWSLPSIIPSERQVNLCSEPDQNETLTEPNFLRQ